MNSYNSFISCKCISFCLKKEEEETIRKEFEKREAEEKARKAQAAQQTAPQHNNTSRPHTETTSVTPSAPPLIEDYLAPPTSYQESSGSPNSIVGNNQREHGTPSDNNQTHSTMPSPPSYSSLFSVQTPRYEKRIVVFFLNCLG